ncbi:M1 family metallopeptidase [Promethearchaeum syntrophicum]|uniref:M1 family metallopeptidase n=1 Tax=Promethearchaeum syntrophicum TaxID=2594042 RepID=A0A5B9DAA4_9ARCH|nr:M1 family metallopeptidase [Candidatus Prometheoarchaeum syntrophicum]
MRSEILIKISVSILIMNILLSNLILTSYFIDSSIQTQSDNKILDKFSNFESPKSLNDPPYESDHLSNYTLSVKLHEENATVEGNLTVDYYNDDLVSFNRIPFHIYPSGMNFTQKSGNITIYEVKTIGESQTFLDFQVISSEHLMWINLTEPLNPTERISFYIHFNTTLPDGGIDRSNYHGTDEGFSKIFKFAVAYPMPAVYDDKDGWNIDPYLQTGDPFYSDMAWYDFFIEVPIDPELPDFIVAATGELMESVTDSDSTIYHYETHLPVRELTFSASRYFICESILANNVNISTFFLPKSQNYWENFALDVAVQAVTLFNETFGAYFFPTLNIVESYTNYGGMEHPLQVYITESIYVYDDPLYYLELIIAHETCHQWFYHIIGNDEIDAGFLDEGLVVWATDYYFDKKYPERNLYDNYYLQYEIRHYYSIEQSPNKINQSVYECYTSGSDYWYIAYKKAPMILHKLRVFLGDEDFLSSIQLFFNRFKFKIAWLSDLEESFEYVYGKSLDWFFKPWFNNKFLPIYSITSGDYDTNSSVLNITIKDRNEEYNNYQYFQQLTLEIYDDKANTIFSNEIWINGTTFLSFNLTTIPDKVRLIFTDSVLAQSIPGTEYVEFVIPKRILNGMPFFSFFISMSFGIIFIIRKIRNKKK